MRGQFVKLIVLGVFLTLSVTPGQADAAGKEPATVQNRCLTPSQVQLQFSLRKLWMDHVTWTRNYIVSAVAGTNDQEKVLARLLKNQQDIGDAIKPYYGESAGNKLAELLREHILIAGKIVGAAKAGKQADVEHYNMTWYRNADEIAAFLSGANPHWSNKTLTDLLYRHLQLVTDAATARIKKDGDADILAYDQGEAHILMLADALAEGIIKQFPDRFK